jgi:hypothetical protein
MRGCRAHQGPDALGRRWVDEPALPYFESVGVDVVEGDAGLEL